VSTVIMHSIQVVESYNSKRMEWKDGVIL